LGQEIKEGKKVKVLVNWLGLTIITIIIITIIMATSKRNSLGGMDCKSQKGEVQQHLFKSKDCMMSEIKITSAAGVSENRQDQTLVKHHVCELP
jgi:hypothetical protein